MRRQDFRHTPTFSLEANIYVFANILGGRQYFMILLDFVAANICVYFSIYLRDAFEYALIFLAQLF